MFLIDVLALIDQSDDRKWMETSQGKTPSKLSKTLIHLGLCHVYVAVQFFPVVQNFSNKFNAYIPLF